MDRTRGISQQAGNTIDDIDQALRDNEAAGAAPFRSSIPTSAEDLRNQEESGIGGSPYDNSGMATDDTPGSQSEGESDGESSGSTSSSSQTGSSAGGSAAASSSGAAASTTASQQAGTAAGTSQTDNQQNSEESSSSSKRGGVRNWYQKHKKAVVVSGAVSVLLGGGGGFMAMPMIQGSVLIHESKIFSRFFAKNQHDSSSRIKQLFRFARAAKNGNAGETRVGWAGSKVFGSVMDELEGKGVTFDTNPNGSLAKVTIDPEKLKASFPEMQDMTVTEQQDFLREKFGLTGDAGYNLFNTGSADAPKFTIDARYLDFKTTRLLAKNSISLVEDGKIPTFIKWRIAARFWNLPNAFHPWEKAKAMAGNKINDKLSISQEEDQQEAAREQATEEPLIEESQPQVDDATSKSSGFKAGALKALTLTGAACAVYNVVDDIVAINHARVVGPAEVRANDVQATASQMESGNDFASWQPAAMVHDQVDKDGKGIFTSSAWLAASNDGTQQGGYQMPPEYKGAFSSNSTAANIRNAINTGMAGTAGALCSSPGQLLQVGVMIGLTFAGDPEVTLAPSAIAKWTGEQLASGITMHFLNDFILNKTTVAKLGAAMFKGPIGGEMLTFGARAMANTAGVASGGISLGNDASTMFAAQEAAADHQAFMHENAFARIFDINNYQSLTGRMADALVPMYDGGPRAFASSLLDLGHTMGSVISNLLPHASAAQPFDWGFPQYGIPDSMLNNPALADPYANASATVSILQSNPDYITRAKTCFGVNITNQTPDQKWDVQPSEDVNTASQAYTDAHCNDISDFNWQRVIMFVEDTNNMNAVACFQGDNEACNTVQGKASAASTSSTSLSAGNTSTNLPTGDTITLAKQILSNPNLSFQTAQDNSYFQQIANTGKATDCGAPVISPKLLGVILALSKSYKIVLGVFDDGHGCDTGFHPKGEAVDLNGINSLDGSVGTGNHIPGNADGTKYVLTPPQMALVKQFYGDAGKVLAANGGGGLGQQECFDSPPPKSATPPVYYFNDYCNHLHMDVGQR